MAESHFFLKIDGIDGSATSHKHVKWIELESWSWGASNAVSGHGTGGHGAGKVHVQDLHFVMKINQASPKIMLACAGGDHIKEAKLACVKAGGAQLEYLKFDLADVYITSYQTGGSGHSDIVPTDQVSLSFAKIKVEYAEQDAKGGKGVQVKVGWDVPANKKI